MATELGVGASDRGADRGTRRTKADTRHTARTGRAAPPADVDALLQDMEEVDDL